MTASQMATSAPYTQKKKLKSIDYSPKMCNFVGEKLFKRFLGGVSYLVALIKKSKTHDNECLIKERFFNFNNLAKSLQ